MAKSQLKLMPHGIIPDQNVIEVWHDEKLIGTLYGSDGPGVRVVSKYPMDIVRGGLIGVGVMEVRIDPSSKV